MVLGMGHDLSLAALLENMYLWLTLCHVRCQVDTCTEKYLISIQIWLSQWNLSEGMNTSSDNDLLYLLVSKSYTRGHQVSGGAAPRGAYTVPFSQRRKEGLTGLFTGKDRQCTQLCRGGMSDSQWRWSFTSLPKLGLNEYFFKSKFNFLFVFLWKMCSIRKHLQYYLNTKLFIKN